MTAYKTSVFSTSFVLCAVVSSEYLYRDVGIEPLEIRPPPAQDYYESTRQGAVYEDGNTKDSGV